MAYKGDDHDMTSRHHLSPLTCPCLSAPHLLCCCAEYGFAWANLAVALSALDSVSGDASLAGERVSE